MILYLKKIKFKLICFSLAFRFYIFNNLITNIPSFKIRHTYLKKVLKIKIGSQTSIHMGCFFTGNNITFGRNTVINRNCFFDSRDAKITIGNNVSISPEVYILTMSHFYNDEMFLHYSKDVSIEDYVWIGARAMIMPGVKLEKGAVLGAMSMATKNLEEYSINVGQPSKQIAVRNKNLKYKLNYFTYFNSDISIP